ncbi:MAG: aminotransferase class V-fold PLP-dependent enzyme, partial [Thermoplasmatota archaeon]
MDIRKIRKDFPFIKHNIYLDNACMTIKPYPVIKAIDEYYEDHPICAGGRSSSDASEKIDDKIENGRESVADLLNADSTDEIIFTKNTTEAINTVARGMKFESNDIVISTEKEHNSNLAPWVRIKDDVGTSYEQVRFKENGDLDIEELKDKMNENVKIVSMVHVSNLDGTSIPAKAVSDIAHDYNALLMLDSAQSVPHMPIDVKDLDVDLLAFSVHKMLGPTGVGVLFGKQEVLEDISPLTVGGGNVKDSTYSTIKLQKSNKKFESGLQNYSGLCAVEPAVTYLKKLGLEEVNKHEEKLNSVVTDELKDHVEIIGPDDHK